MLADMDRVGLARIIHCSGFPEHEITSLYFEFSSVCRVLPTEPDRIPIELWDYLVHCLQLVSTLINTAEKAELEEARHNAIRKFLPQARDTVQHEYEEQRQEGTVELRLAALVRDPSSPEQSREVCKEALRLEREERYESCRHLTTEGMGHSRAVIVDNALGYVHQSITDSPDQFAPVDLMIRLLDLLHAVRQESDTEPDGDSAEDAVDRIVLGLGNVLFSDELGL
ncbi:hypothetical protein [Marinobacter zhanjiangensis]|uniref:TIGR02444 family protein n=1 Tax=Marinobacter zhanjiangensis TaxID=578215 RepID=A0ABQ3AW60_9GAMM|nr:hypothetical protein [Marinobacter zhanjiangensis]GGY65803.1 hypothetical protein GCM10007071_10720 [Marinobacter zhanjiangensis]